MKFYICKCGREYKTRGWAMRHVRDYHKDEVAAEIKGGWTPDESIRRAYEQLVKVDEAKVSPALAKEAQASVALDGCTQFDEEAERAARLREKGGDASGGASQEEARGPSDVTSGAGQVGVCPDQAPGEGTVESEGVLPSGPAPDSPKEFTKQAIQSAINSPFFPGSFLMEPVTGEDQNPREKGPSLECDSMTSPPPTDDEDSDVATKPPCPRCGAMTLKEAETICQPGSGVPGMPDWCPGEELIFPDSETPGGGESPSIPPASAGGLSSTATSSGQGEQAPDVEGKPASPVSSRGVTASDVPGDGRRGGASIPVVDFDTCTVESPNEFLLDALRVARGEKLPDPISYQSAVEAARGFPLTDEEIDIFEATHDPMPPRPDLVAKALERIRASESFFPGCTLICRDSDDRERWLQERTKYIGSSDAAAVVGISNYKSPWDVWAEKTGLEKPKLIDNERMRWGRYLEPAILEGYSKEHNSPKVRMGGELLVSKEFPWASATVDSWELEGPSREEVFGGYPWEPRYVILELKTTAMREHWREGPPAWVSIQVLHQLKVTGLRKAKVLVLFFGNKLEVYTIDLDCPEQGQLWRQAAEWLMEKEEQFWALVKSRTVPQVDHSDGCRRVLGKIYMAAFPGSGNRQVKKLPKEAHDWVWNRINCKEEIKLAEKQAQESENRLRAALGDHWEGETDTHWVSWKPDKNGKRTLRIKEKASEGG